MFYARITQPLIAMYCRPVAGLFKFDSICPITAYLSRKPHSSNSHVVNYFTGYVYVRPKRPCRLSFCSLLMYFLSYIARLRYMSSHTSLLMIRHVLLLLKKKLKYHNQTWDERNIYMKHEQNYPSSVMKHTHET